ncbi:MAG: hypothetical protein AB2733_13095 [Candidatus Thiodiazotropha taylori]
MITAKHDATYVSIYRGCLNYFKALEIIYISDETCPPDSFGFLASHSLELALKAYLLSQGMSEEKVRRKVGHSLKNAWGRSVDNGLEIEAELPGWCKDLDAAHDWTHDYLMRYARVNTGLVLPSQQVLYESVGRVIDSVGVQIGLDRSGNFIHD